MPRAPRILLAGGFYHVYNRGVEKRPILFDDQDRKTFLQILANTVHEFQLHLYAYCLLDNHYHLFAQTPQGNLDRAMQSLQGQYAHHVNLKYKRVGPLFQGRYKSRLVEVETYALVLARYIHWNPLDAGIVQRLEEYPWSSYVCYIGKFPTWNWLRTEWLLAQFHPDPALARRLFQEFHQTKPPESETKILCRMRLPLGKPKGV